MIEEFKETSELPPIYGELPPSSNNTITVCFFITESNFDLDELHKALEFCQRNLDIHFHAHIINNRSYSLEKIMLFLASQKTLSLTITYESQSFLSKRHTRSVIEIIEIIRFFQLVNLCPGKKILCPPLKLPEEINIILEEINKFNILISEDNFLKIALDGKPKSISILGSIAKPLIKEYYNENQKITDRRTIIQKVLNKINEQNKNILGCFPKYYQSDYDNNAKPKKTANTLWKVNQNLKVIVMRPDLSLPFKSPPLVSDPLKRKKSSPFISGDQGILREEWKKCFELIENGLLDKGHQVISITRPGRELTSTLANLSTADVVIMPHRQKFQCEPIKMPSLFLMQIGHSWLFTLDEEGWGAGAKNYPYNKFYKSPSNSGVYEKYRKKILTNNYSKFSQPKRRTKEQLVKEGILPNQEFIFFPCQIPDDEVVRFFCKEKEEDILRELANWSNKNQVMLLIKKHPFDQNIFTRFQQIITGPYVKWIDASIHDIIENCKAVYTINSGVGHEAILHGKPIVMFGSSEYDQLAIKATIKNLDYAYEQVNNWNRNQMLISYRRFYHWFTQDVAIDMSDIDNIDSISERTIRKIESLIK